MSWRTSHTAHRFRTYLGTIANATIGRIRTLLVGSDSKQDFRVPEEMDFLNLVWGQEDDCEAVTDKLIPRLGEKAPACLEDLGTVLSLLDRMASCWWGCRGGDHLVEYLCGRVASNARASLRMMRFGFYDEALLLCRSIGETSNLIQLFAIEEGALADWKSLSRRDRLNNFGPMRVRKRLEKLIGPLIKEDRYRLLSEQSAHVVPHTRPQSHNMLRLPHAGAFVQKEGVLICLNELAFSLLPATLFGAQLLDVDDDVKKQVNLATRDLAEDIGGVTITEIEEYRREILKNPTVREHFAQIAAALERIQAEKRKT